LAAGYANTIEKPELAEKYALQSSVAGIENYKGLEMLGEVYYKKATQQQNPELKNQWLEKAQNTYLQSIRENDSYSPAYLGLGAVYFQQKNVGVALENFEKAISLDKNNLNAYLFAAGCCNYFINQNSSESTMYTTRALSFYGKADKLNPDNPQIMLNLGFLNYRAGECKKAVSYLSKIATFSGLSEQQRQQAQQCIRQCQ
jgi:tetratricopeptide (TPR) repeat protein